MDKFYGPAKTRSPKAVWVLYGFDPTRWLGAKLSFEMDIAQAELQDRTELQQDYDSYIADLRRYGEKYGVKGLDKLGGPQFRRSERGVPFMSHQEAAAYGLKEHEYETDPDWERWVQTAFEAGGERSSDGFWRGKFYPEHLANSARRYQPHRLPMSVDDKILADEIAREMFRQYEPVLSRLRVTSPEEVAAYVTQPRRQGTSAGTGFMNIGTKKRALELGWGRALVARTYDQLRSGNITRPWWHLFAKEQAVPINFAKDIRTVSAQDWPSLYVKLAVNLDAAKANGVLVAGTGSHMPLDQRMSVVFQKLLEKAGGPTGAGGYLMKDAHAYDSRVGEMGHYVNIRLKELGFKDHPNGRNIASVYRALMEGMQDGWMFAVTMPKRESIALTVDNELAVETLTRLRPDIFGRVSDEPRKCVLLTPGQTSPQWAAHQGSFLASDLAPLDPDDRIARHYTNSDVRNVAITRFVDASNAVLLSNAFEKNRGGGTGDATTTDNNTWSYKALNIAAYCRAFNKTPTQYFEEVEMANTGDDSMDAMVRKWSAADVASFKLAALHYSLDLDVDTANSITEVKYLGNMVRWPTQEDRISLEKWQKWVEASSGTRPEVPDFVVYDEGSQLLTRSMAFKAYQCSKPSWRIVAAQGAIGRAQRRAFDPKGYMMFAEMYRQCVQGILDVAKIPSTVIHDRDEDDLPFVRVSQEKHLIQWRQNAALTTSEFPAFRLTGDPRVDAQIERAYIDRLWETDTFTPVGSSGPRPFTPADKRYVAQTARQLALLGSLNTVLRFPAYKSVLKNWMNLTPISDRRRDDAFWSKLRKQAPGLSDVEESVREMLDIGMTHLKKIPDQVKKIIPPLAGFYPGLPFSPPSDIVSRATTVVLDVEDVATLQAMVKEGPFADCCNPSAFFSIEWADKDKREDAKAVHKDFYRAQMVVANGVYFGLVLAEKFFLPIPIIGVAYKLFLFMMIDMTRVYSLLNLLYWCSTLRSSRVISLMMPRDPYMWTKRAAISITSLLPDVIFYAGMMFMWIIHAMPPLVDALAQWANEGGATRAVAPDMTNNPWLPYALPYINQAKEEGEVFVAAPTSTGKSTWFVAAIASQWTQHKMFHTVICVPRNVLRDSWSQPFPIVSQKLRTGVTRNESAQIYIGTYGHILNRLADFPNNTVFLFDEFHESSGEMVELLWAIRERRYEHPGSSPVLLMSATPVPMKGLETCQTLRPDIQRRHKTTIHLRDTRDQIDNFQWAAEKWPDKARKCLITVSELGEIHPMMEKLAYLGYSAGPLSSKDREIPVGVDVIVATSGIVVSGTNLPGIELLISNGVRVAKHEGQFLKPHPRTDPDWETQLDGRVGRYSDGIVVKPSWAGTGSKIIIYPTGARFASPEVAEFFKVPRLAIVDKPIFSKWPYLGLSSYGAGLDEELVTGGAFIHLLGLSDIQPGSRGAFSWKEMYQRYFIDKKPLHEDYSWVNMLMQNLKGDRIAPFDLALQAVLGNAFEYNINGITRPSRPIFPVGGTWLEDIPKGIKIVSHDMSDLANAYEEVVKERVKIAVAAEKEKWERSSKAKTPRAKGKENYTRSDGAERVPRKAMNQELFRIRNKADPIKYPQAAEPFKTYPKPQPEQSGRVCEDHDAWWHPAKFKDSMSQLRAEFYGATLSSEVPFDCPARSGKSMSYAHRQTKPTKGPVYCLDCGILCYHIEDLKGPDKVENPRSGASAQPTEEDHVCCPLRMSRKSWQQHRDNCKRAARNNRSCCCQGDTYTTEEEPEDPEGAMQHFWDVWP
jgi:hypothetical protein